jgi:glutaredoxin 3
VTRIVVYTKDWCGYCRAAKQLLQQLGLSYEEIDVTNDVATYRAMVELAGGRSTVPQIFADGVGLGGYTDLARLVHEGKFPPAA